MSNLERRGAGFTLGDGANSNVNARRPGHLLSQENPLVNPPITHGTNPEAMRDELDYEEMIVLSGMFRRWAVYEPRLTPEQRTGMIGWSADLEQIAAWVGKGWQAPDPPERSLFKLMARLEQEASGVINIAHAKHWLGLD
jgi:hypothetical protein